MTGEESIKIKETSVISARLRDYLQMMKPNLTTMVVFTSVIGYLLAPGVTFNWVPVVILFIGGMLSTNGALIINQFIEKDSDKFMKRTSGRPLPSGRITIIEAAFLISISSLIGILMIGFYFNWAAAGLSLLSLLIYGFAYTPLKKISPIATFVGAIPGALPPLIGWVAGTGSMSSSLILGGLALFSIQFFWQFPHVWAIAWLNYDDYLKAGIRMLPTKTATPQLRTTALFCIFYSLPLIPLVMLPNQMGITGKISMWIAVACSSLYVIVSMIFFRSNTKKSAKRLFYTSLMYIPIVLLSFFIDKIS